LFKTYHAQQLLKRSIMQVTCSKIFVQWFCNHLVQWQTTQTKWSTVCTWNNQEYCQSV